MSLPVETYHQLSKDFPFKIEAFKSDDKTISSYSLNIMHFHHDMQIIYVVEGQIEVRTLGHTYILHPGEGMFINQEVAHHVIKKHDYNYKCLFFEKELLGFCCMETIPDIKQDAIYLQKELSQNILDCIEHLIVLKEQYDILAYIHMIYAMLRKNKIATTQTTAQNRVNQCLRFLHNHYNEELSIEAIAASGHISVSECLRCFKEVMQITPYRYLMHIRIEKAKQLLVETDEPVGIICQQVGFHQTSHFGKCFKEATGLTPRDYRKSR